MKPGEALIELLQQHSRLRDLAGMTLELATRLLAGEQVRGFHQSVIDLGRSLAEHNVCEEALLAPLLKADQALGAARAGRMLEEHVAEHAAFREALEGDDLEVAGRLAELVEDLDAHMQAEERTFLSPAVLRDIDAPGRPKSA